jgi:isopenicillin N synthase-like dioxygenase
MAAWGSFLSQPEYVRNRFTYLKDDLKGNSGSGYEPPNPDKFDPRKHTFHAQLRDADWLLKTAREACPEAVELVTESLALLEEMKVEAVPFAEAFAREFGQPDFPKNLQDGFAECILRLLDYPPGYEPEQIIAKEHPDKGGGTMHLFETCEGVERYALDTREWVPFPVNDGQAVVFSGMRMQYLTQCELKALYHRVRATREVAEQGRRSAVLFLNFNGTPYHNKGEHGSTQVYTGDYIYDVPFEEFRTRFAEPLDAAA